MAYNPYNRQDDANNAARKLINEYGLEYVLKSLIEIAKSSDEDYFVKLLDNLRRTHNDYVNRYNDDIDTDFVDTDI